MNIGFVSTWLERGATYVTRSYMDLLKEDHRLFVFARGGEYFDSDMKFEGAAIEKGMRLRDVEVNWKQIEKWVEKNRLQVIIFNEQENLDCVFRIKMHFPDVVVGSYIDYYKLNTVKDFEIFDFLLCNTKRHYEAFNWHPGAYYIPWGTDLDLFKCDISRHEQDGVVFFHSAGMSNRKGTITLLEAFVEGKLKAAGGKLIIHTQKALDCPYTEKELSDNNIHVIIKTVPHPGLYYMGDVYVYPTTLDGLGLTIYEALASGMPVITTDAAPMNEIIRNEESNGRLVEVERVCSRSDGYYWPLSFVSRESLIREMNYYLDNQDKIEILKRKARQYAEANLDIHSRRTILNEIVLNEKSRITPEQAKALHNVYSAKKNKEVFHSLAEVVLPDVVKGSIREHREKKRYRV